MALVARPRRIQDLPMLQGIETPHDRKVSIRLKDGTIEYMSYQESNRRQAIYETQRCAELEEKYKTTMVELEEAALQRANEWEVYEKENALQKRVDTITRRLDREYQAWQTLHDGSPHEDVLGDDEAKKLRPIIWCQILERLRQLGSIDLPFWERVVDWRAETICCLNYGECFEVFNKVPKGYDGFSYHQTTGMPENLWTTAYMLHDWKLIQLVGELEDACIGADIDSSHGRICPPVRWLIRKREWVLFEYANKCSSSERGVVWWRMFPFTLWSVGFTTDEKERLIGSIPFVKLRIQ
jgi:hypothetical protein